MDSKVAVFVKKLNKARCMQSNCEFARKAFAEQVGLWQELSSNRSSIRLLEVAAIAMHS